MLTCANLWSYQAEFLLEWEMFQTNIADKIKALLLLSVIPPLKKALFNDNVERQKMNFRLPTATMFTRTRYNVRHMYVAYLDYTCILITNLMHWLFIHKILFSSTCFKPQVLIFRRIELYTCSIWYCHSSWWPVGRQLCTDRPSGTLTESDSTICCMYTTVSSWRWALEARNM